MKRPRTLRKQIVTSFVAFAAGLSLLFAASSFLVAYIVEDSLFEATIAEEAARQRAHWAQHRRLAATGRDWISVHARAGTLPADLRREMARLGPREEYAGDAGRHYHLTPLQLDDGAPGFVVAEVGQRLAVRPMEGTLLTAIGLLSAAILVVAAALGYWLARRATAPLSRLVEAVSSHEPGGAPTVSAADYPANEVGTLAATLEAMLERTKAFVERETRFTRDASHELRTPLAVIRSSAELIESKGPIPTAIAGPLGRIHNAARQMEKSISLLLMLAREERSPKSPPTALLPLVENIILDEGLACDPAGSDVAVVVPADCSTGLDAGVATAIVGNLVRNVFEHAPGCKLRIYVEGADLVVADTGPGLPPDLLAGVQPEVERQGSLRGSGLGLTIVSRLCRLNGIAFSLETRPGGGTIARVGLVKQA